MGKHIEVVGVDHGWSGMKTATQVFTTGVKEITTEPAFFQNIVEYNGSYYKVGGKRLEVMELKVENDNFYLLTLAAVADRIKMLPKRVVVVDIGSWTIDIMPIEDYAPNEAECITIREGLIKCMRTINEECIRLYGKELSEEDIQEVMRTGKNDKLPQKYLDIVKECLKAYVEKVYNILLEHGYNLEVTDVVFVGGGASVVNRFGEYAGKKRTVLCYSRGFGQAS